MDEMYYYAFCIGYDFMNNYFKNCKVPECDVVFEECKKLSKRFMDSKEYKDLNHSGYEQLEKWLDNNKEKIKEEYIKCETNGDLPYGEEIHHNGYICLVNDYNDDNKKETLVEIYKSKKDMKNGNYLEIVSLKNDQLEKNIRNYVNENYKTIRKKREAR